MKSIHRLVAVSAVACTLWAAPSTAASIQTQFPWATAPVSLDCSTLNYANPQANFRSPKGEFNLWLTGPAQANDLMLQCALAQAAELAPEPQPALLAAATVAPVPAPAAPATPAPAVLTAAVTVLPRTGATAPAPALALALAGLGAALLARLRRRAA